MKTYKAVFNEAETDGVFGISLVETPAMEGLFIALSKHEIQLKEINKERRELIGLVLEPNKPIYRNQGGEEFNIVFDEETIKKLSYNFFKAGNQKNSSLEHEERIEGVTFVESWIVADSEKDKSATFGFSYPVGSWVATMKVDSDDIWNNYVKTGKVQGFSVDAMLKLKEINTKTEVSMTKEDFNEAFKFLKDLPAQIALALNPKEKEEEVKLGMVKAEDGSVTFEYEGDTPTAGAAMWVNAEDGSKIPVPVGEYKVEGGATVIVSEEGIIGEVRAAEVEEEQLSEDPAGDIIGQIKSIMVKYHEDNKLAQEQLKAELKKEVEDLKEEIVELKKEPAADPIKGKPTQVNLSEMTPLQKRRYYRELERKN